MSPQSPYCNFQTFIFLWWKEKAWGRQRERRQTRWIDIQRWFVCASRGTEEWGREFIITPFQILWFKLTLAGSLQLWGKSPGEGGDGKVTSLQNQQGDERWTKRRQAGHVGIKLINVFSEIHPVRAKCFHSPPYSRAQLYTDGIIQLPGQTDNFNSKWWIKSWHEKFLLFSVKRGKKDESRGNYLNLNDHTGVYFLFFYI